jgi:hypothetical protein
MIYIYKSTAYESLTYLHILQLLCLIVLQIVQIREIVAVSLVSLNLTQKSVIISETSHSR